MHLSRTDVPHIAGRASCRVSSPHVLYLRLFPPLHQPLRVTVHLWGAPLPTTPHLKLPEYLGRAFFAEIIKLWKKSKKKAFGPPSKKAWKKWKKCELAEGGKRVKIKWKKSEKKVNWQKYHSARIPVQENSVFGVKEWTFAWKKRFLEWNGRLLRENNGFWCEKVGFCVKQISFWLEKVDLCVKTQVFGVKK